VGQGRKREPRDTKGMLTFSGACTAPVLKRLLCAASAGWVEGRAPGTLALSADPFLAAPVGVV
jgi:hypothetical protein